jgi:hypothetical protein
MVWKLFCGYRIHRYATVLLYCRRCPDFPPRRDVSEVLENRVLWNGRSWEGRKVLEKLLFYNVILIRRAYSLQYFSNLVFFRVFFFTLLGLNESKQSSCGIDKARGNSASSK